MRPRFRCPLDQRKTERLFRTVLILANLFLAIALSMYISRGLFRAIGQMIIALAPFFMNMVFSMECAFSTKMSPTVLLHSFGGLERIVRRSCHPFLPELIS